MAWGLEWSEAECGVALGADQGEAWWEEDAAGVVVPDTGGVSTDCTQELDG